MALVHEYAHALTLIFSDDTDPCDSGKISGSPLEIQDFGCSWKLVDLAPKNAVVLRDGKEMTIPAEQVAAGDTVVIRPGESIPVDGIVTEGYGYVDQAAITGESIPVEKQPGDTVISATINKNDLPVSGF